MKNARYVSLAMLLAALIPASASSATVTATPIAGLHDLVGTWKCTFSGGGMNLKYNAVYASDLAGHALRETTTLPGGGDEELIAYDAAHHSWTATVVDAGGTATVMHAPGSSAKHIVYRSVYPDASVGVVYDRVSATKYTQHGTFVAGGKTIVSVDTCTR